MLWFVQIQISRLQLLLVFLWLPTGFSSCDDNHRSALSTTVRHDEHVWVCPAPPPFNCRGCCVTKTMNSSHFHLQYKTQFTFHPRASHSSWGHLQKRDSAFDLVWWWTEMMNYSKAVYESHSWTTLCNSASVSLVELVVSVSQLMLTCHQYPDKYGIRTNGSVRVFTRPVSSRHPSCLDTYSADFQKCPGWDSLRLSLGSFSSISASRVKVGLSLRSYAQQADRISWEDKPPLSHWTEHYEWWSTQKPSLYSDKLHKHNKHSSCLNDRHTHSDFLAQADLCQNLLYALSAAHLPDSSFYRLVGDWPVPSLKLIPNGA